MIGSITSAAHSEPPASAAQPDYSEEPLWSVDSPLGPVEYRVARGMRLGRTGLNIGGFTTFEVDKPESDAGSFSIEGVNFLVLFQPIEPLRGFMELEVGDLLLVEFGEDGRTTSNTSVKFERLYGEYSFNDAVTTRLGKFQTPVGRWNMVPAEPFVWTANQPILLETFDARQTGGLLYGSFYPGSSTLRYWLYSQFFDPFDPESDEDEADRSVGGRLEFSNFLGGWSLGTSYLASLRDDDWSHLLGFDGEYRYSRLELTSEFVYRRGGSGDTWGIYLQSVVEIAWGFNLVARYEYSSPSGPDPAFNIGDVGVAWIPTSFLYLKATYRFSDLDVGEDPRGLKASLAILF